VIAWRVAPRSALRTMIQRATSTFGHLCLLFLWACAGAGDAEKESSPDAPVVIETTPRDGEEGVDSGLDAITATFSEAMDLDGWSWVTEVGRSAPSITGLPFYLSETTTILPVRLEAETSYVIWINSPDDEELRNFKDSDGVSARAHRIRFTTGPAR
jgi:Bacterial Ig-like domain